MTVERFQPLRNAAQLDSVDTDAITPLTMNYGYPIPLPPLAEQHRIVAEVDELMALCDQLEASLTGGEQTRSRLLEAVLHNNMEPA